MNILILDKDSDRSTLPSRETCVLVHFNYLYVIVIENEWDSFVGLILKIRKVSEMWDEYYVPLKELVSPKTASMFHH